MELKKLEDNKKLKKANYKRDIKKFSFLLRSIDTWNGLNSDILHSKAINESKARVDKSR